jgi:hypothetical protein
MASTDEARRQDLRRIQASGAADAIAHELSRVRSQVAELNLRSRRMPQADRELMRQLVDRARFLESELRRERAAALRLAIERERERERENTVMVRYSKELDFGPSRRVSASAPGSTR